MVRLLLASGLGALLLLMAGCANLPPLEGRSESTALAGTAASRLGRAVAPELAAHPGLSGIYPLLDPRDAFAARVLLADAADRSLDVQYYIWRGDQSGRLLFEALWRAAERGVRVRLLLDDINTGGQDATLAAFDAHPNVEVRLYNPLVQRNARALSFLTDFTRVNRRMHNKSFTADNQASIVGGRNIGNEYFAAGDEVVFADLDVLAVGPAVQAVSAEFDRYWNSASAYPASSLTGPAAPDAAMQLQAGFAAANADPQSLRYIEAVRATPLLRELFAGRLSFEWTTAQLVSDDPAKTLAVGTPHGDDLLLPDLLRRIGAPQRELDLISPYFVPGQEGTAVLAGIAQRGVKVRILTNSLAASDVGAVHAGYAKWRERLLQAGVKLYEFKPSADAALRERDGKRKGSSSAALHAKTFEVDRERVFVGSFNFDPRSALLNTEMGLVIASPALASELAEFFDNDARDVAYEVQLAPGGHGLLWLEQTPAGELRYDTEPETTVWRRMGVGVLSVLPIDWLL